MDNYRNKNIMDKVIKIEERINSLEEILEYFNDEKKHFRTRCNHEMIFVNYNIETNAYGKVRYGTCLVCGKSFYLEPKYYHNGKNTPKLYYHDVDNNCDYLEDNVLDITNTEFVDEYGELLEISKNIYREMLQREYYLYTEDEIKNEIIKNFKSKTKKKIK